MAQLNGRVALISGAAQGIGAATARRFVAEGARVMLADIEDEKGELVAKELGDRAAYLHLDVRDERRWVRVVDATVDRFGSLDLLINSAGTLLIAAIEDTSLTEFNRVVDVNQIGTFLGVRAVVDAMRSAGGGSIVNVSSENAIEAVTGLGAYCGAKHGVRGITQSAAMELGRWGIRINDVLAGAGNVEFVLPWLPKDLDMANVAQTRPIPRLGTIDEVVEVVLFLASDASSYCTGSELSVDGGDTGGGRAPGLSWFVS